ncbi:LytTR family two component transcriptional regulator [Pseudoduganella flava]|uniref:LytTR family two component transcriptional regulator n=1 Tax=Pseudoduganella flava TaxID=871742 RepID=A0A562Q678_9BURK|nr:LytTR family DNA-binding domain-containing protein [Pseudoduganella flava]QGZ41695.1 response regulator [Pseudoduganella flava]TWI51690.1 LytTR family two component transcriptional regulator [Pseudoduganella flava]
MDDLRPRVLIADDEPLLRSALREQLHGLWPEADVVGEAADGYEALRLARDLSPDLAFLDIRMPGLSGLDVARTFGGRTHVVFVTAYDEHAVAAFDQGALDYVLKPVEPVRLARTIARVRERIALPPPDLAQLGRGVQPAAAPAWIQASVGQTVHFIDLQDIVYFAAEDKYTRVVTPRIEAHIRTPLKELAEMLGGAGFWQVHRGYVVAVRHVAAATRDGDGAMWLALRGHPVRLPVSQRFQHRFKAM